MATRTVGSAGDTVTAPALQRARAPGAPAEEFQDWCLRTYGDSGKTKTVTRRKYNKILQTLLQGDEENSNALFLHEKSGNHINAKFKFWVKSKGFQVRTLPDAKGGSAGGPVLYVPIKAATVSDGSSFSHSCVCVCVNQEVRVKLHFTWLSATCST